MYSTDTGHAIICTQTQYAMLRLTPEFQLEISPVYKVRGSATQVTDTSTLVLFYTHAALRAGATYPRASSASIAMRVTLPAFPTSVSQPYEALRSKSRGSFLRLPWVRFDGDVQSSSNDVTIAYGRLILFFVASRRLVAKTAYAPAATQRLVCEYDAYIAMRTLQGVAIPKVIGIFTTKDGKHTVLMMSYAGEALTAFSELERRDKLGVQHNDLEPRNVTRSSSGPLIIDFDRASLDHHCPGASCEELLQVAQALGLDPAVEMETPEEETAKPLAAHSVFLIFAFAVKVLAPPAVRVVIYPENAPFFGKEQLVLDELRHLDLLGIFCLDTKQMPDLFPILYTHNLANEPIPSAKRRVSSRVDTDQAAGDGKLQEVALCVQGHDAAEDGLALVATGLSRFSWVPARKSALGHNILVHQTTEGIDGPVLPRKTAVSIVPVPESQHILYGYFDPDALFPDLWNELGDFSEPATRLAAPILHHTSPRPGLSITSAPSYSNIRLSTPPALSALPAETAPASSTSSILALELPSFPQPEELSLYSDNADDLHEDLTAGEELKVSPLTRSYLKISSSSDRVLEEATTSGVPTRANTEPTDPSKISAEINDELEHYLAGQYPDIGLSTVEFFNGSGSGDITGSNGESIFDSVPDFEADSALSFDTGIDSRKCSVVSDVQVPEFAEVFQYTEPPEPEHHMLSCSFSYEDTHAVFDSDRASLEHFNIHLPVEPESDLDVICAVFKH
ncbi:hypothetical protein FB451DRAFT_1378575 [Mycena latifolia]|nr:hypothetical protein FB451DRAFT_1378575 [Mycena latifolia]